MASLFIYAPYPTTRLFSSQASSDKAKKKLPTMEPPTSASGPPDHVLYGNPDPGPMQDLARNRRFEEWKKDVARWEAEEKWERERPKDVIKWREIKY
ncbi:hypothetical protein PG994_012910 [Apiospora phragmitis]|uniref:Uncharacterized protein n=1 Tax=Apiospora phragmitis TaxID=2905665 RepID=A0ABR1T7M3_9PEZI